MVFEITQSHVKQRITQAAKFYLGKHSATTLVLSAASVLCKSRFMRPSDFLLKLYLKCVFMPLNYQVFLVISNNDEQAFLAFSGNLNPSGILYHNLYLFGLENSSISIFFFIDGL